MDFGCASFVCFRLNARRRRESSRFGPCSSSCKARCAGRLGRVRLLFFGHSFFFFPVRIVLQNLPRSRMTLQLFPVFSAFCLFSMRCVLGLQNPAGAFSISFSSLMRTAVCTAARTFFSIGFFLSVANACASFVPGLRPARASRTFRIFVG